MSIRFNDRWYSIYMNSPVFFQNCAISLLGIKRWVDERTPEFQKIVTMLIKSMNWDLNHMEEFRKARLSRVLQAASHTPFYENLLKNRKDIKEQPFDVLASMPVLDKDTLRTNPEAFINREYRGVLIRQGTSGTTGTPLHIYSTPESISWGRALVWRHRTLCGHPYGKNTFAQLGGYQIVPKKQNKSPFWRINVPLRQVLLSTYHIRPDTALAYVECLKKYKIRHIEGYPSAIYSLAKCIGEEMEYSGIRSVFFGSEPMRPFQKKCIINAFKCRIWNYYGLTERVVSAMEIPSLNGLYVNQEDCVCEILNPTGKPVKKGDTGEIVGTSLSNIGYPILRYRTSDISRIITSEAKSIILSPIDTKREDLLRMPDGSLLSASNLTYPFKEIDSIRESQLYQKVPHILQVRIVPDGDIGMNEIEKLIRGLKECLPSEVQVEIVKVKSIPRTSSGKFRFCISEVEVTENLIE